MANILESVTGFFGDRDNLPWTDDLTIQECERELDDKAQSSCVDEMVRNLAWALVHSRRERDVLRGISMLQTVLLTEPQKERRREILYLLAVGYFRTQNLSLSRTAVNEVLKISPGFLQAVKLKRVVEHKITSDGILGAGLVVAATLSAGVAIAVGVTAGAVAIRSAR